MWLSSGDLFIFSVKVSTFSSYFFLLSILWYFPSHKTQKFELYTYGFQCNIELMGICIGIKSFHIICVPRICSIEMWVWNEEGDHVATGGHVEHSSGQAVSIAVARWVCIRSAIVHYSFTGYILISRDSHWFNIFWIIQTERPRTIVIFYNYKFVFLQFQ